MWVFICKYANWLSCINVVMWTDLLTHATLLHMQMFYLCTWLGPDVNFSLHTIILWKFYLYAKLFMRTKSKFAYISICSIFMLDWHSCQICYPFEIKLLLLYIIIIFNKSEKCLLYKLHFPMFWKKYSCFFKHMWTQSKNTFAYVSKICIYANLLMYAILSVWKHF